MPNRFLIRGLPEAWSYWLIPLVAALPAVGGTLRLVGHGGSDGWVWIAVGASLCLLSVVILAVRVSRRQWLLDMGNGLEIGSSGGLRLYRDAQVAGVGYSARRVVGLSGRENAIRHRLRLRLDEGSGGEALDVGFRTPIADGPAVGALVDRLCKAVAAAARKDLDKGREFSGDGWTLRRGRLRVDRDGAQSDWPIESLSAVDVCENHLCVWTAGRDEPILRSPLEGINSPVLGLLLTDRMSRRAVVGPDAKPDPGGSDLGRLMFEHRGGRVPSYALLVGAILLAAVAIGLLRTDGASPSPLTTIVGWGMVLGATAVALAALHSLFVSVRCHANGVVSVGPFGENRLLFRDVKTVTGRLVKSYINGVYTSTSAILTLEPFPESGASSVCLDHYGRQTDAELERLRDHVSAVIADRMARSLAEGRTVEWTAHLRIRPDGVEYRPAGLLMRGEWRFVPFKQLGGLRLQDGRLQLLLVGSDAPFVEQDASEPNFHPGFLLLGGLLTAGGSVGREPKAT